MKTKSGYASVQLPKPIFDKLTKNGATHLEIEFTEDANVLTMHPF